MSKKDEMLAIVSGVMALTLSLGSEPSAEAAPKKGGKAAECFGVNSCKGTNGCSVSAEQIGAANKAYKDRFAKSKPVDCAGNSDCAAKNGFVAWQSKPSEKDCFSAGGFVFEKAKDGSLSVKDKG